MTTRKLIEVALPLEAINRESAREKSIRHGHPSTLHLWWARRPLAAARAVLFAQLVDDPSSHPEEFPTEAEQKAERDRLHGIIERLVVWENIRDEKLLAEAHEEILKSTDGNPPPILDPFCGGGTIPLEAQRLGLEAHASDLNPVAVLITKALIEIPPKFRDQPPVFPGLADSRIGGWKGAEGLAADVRAYGQWMRDEAERRIGHLYPKATLPDGTKATVTAWIWARTVTCPNPACGIEMPLVRSWWLGKKKGKEAYVVPSIVGDPTHPSGKRVRFEIGHDNANAPTSVKDGTVNRAGAVCVACQSGIDLAYVRAEGQADRMSAQLMAVAAEAARSRLYVAPTPEDVERSDEAHRASELPEISLPAQALGFRVQGYGMTRWTDLFTDRQLVALWTLSHLVTEAHDQVAKNAVAFRPSSGQYLEAGGHGGLAYADAVATYLGLGVSKATDYYNALCAWRSDTKNEGIGHLFTRNAIPMVWDFCEANPFSSSSGNIKDQFNWVSKVLETSVRPDRPAFVAQEDAATREFSNSAVSTDPPYYDNIGYADLSDFFYIWLRLSLGQIHPGLLSTVVTPKVSELVAEPFRHGGKAAANDFFEEGFRKVFARARAHASRHFPVAVWYAFKQSSDTVDGVTSSGWETLLDGMIHAGWTITATWPNRSELGNRVRNIESNALASSIVLALRPRPEDAPSTDRRALIAALHAELPQALRDLQHGAIAPVDLPQAAIGPGMSVFSRYSSVIEADGSPMSVRSALARINEILDQVLSEQEGDFDAPTRFAIAWYRQHGYGTGAFGDADSLARARNTAVEGMDRHGILTSRAGRVTLKRPSDLPSNYDVLSDEHTSTWEALHHGIRVLQSEGVAGAGAFLAAAVSRVDGAVDADLVKELAFLLFSVAEKNGWTKDALAFNTVATSWPDIVAASSSVAGAPGSTQTAFAFDEES